MKLKQKHRRSQKQLHPKDNTMTSSFVSPAPHTGGVYHPPVRPSTEHMPVLDLDALPKSTFWTVLGRALTLRRDYKTQTEGWFVAWLCNRLPVSLIDAAGNIYVDLRTTPSHRTMFTSHTDSVHSSGGVNKVHVDGKFWRATQGSALGADDGSGIAIMCHMIEAGVPGLYVFFRGEERGGVGSSWAAKELPHVFEDLDRAVAFDRAGYYDIITHQSGGRCCSEEFAQALANQLSTEASWYLPSSHGVYTDTAEFTSMIPECTNVSVGYKNQHGDMEEQDVEFLWELAQLCTAVDWDNLPTKRDPKVVESRYDYYDTDWLDYKSKWMTSGTRSDGLVEFEDEDEDEAARTLEYALWEAIDEATRQPARFTPLLDLIALNTLPDDPGAARKQMNVNLLDESVITMAMDMLDNGFPAHQVLDEIWDMLAWP